MHKCAPDPFVSSTAFEQLHVKHGCPWMALSVSESTSSGSTPWLECVHVSGHIACPADSLYMPYPFEQLPGKHGHPCVALCMCTSHDSSGPIPCLECVHIGVHISICTWPPKSAPHPLYSYMQTWVPLWGTVCIPVIPIFIPHIGYNMYMHDFI